MNGALPAPIRGIVADYFGTCSYFLRDPCMQCSEETLQVFRYLRRFISQNALVFERVDSKLFVVTDSEVVYCTHCDLETYSHGAKDLVISARANLFRTDWQIKTELVVMFHENGSVWIPSETFHHSALVPHNVMAVKAFLSRLPLHQAIGAALNYIPPDTVFRR